MFSRTVPDSVDILVTHSPPKYHLDIADWGDEYLLNELWRVRPKLHVFGHLHAGYGRDTLLYNNFERLYETVCRGAGSILTLMQMAILLLWTRIMGDGQPCQRTELVNATSIGGLKDTDHRPPHIVYL